MWKKPFIVAFSRFSKKWQNDLNKINIAIWSRFWPFLFALHGDVKGWRYYQMKKLRFIFVFLCTTILLSCREKTRAPLLLSDLSQSCFILGEPFSECYALAEKDTNITMLARKWYGKHQRQDSLFSFAYFRTYLRLTDVLSVPIDSPLRDFEIPWHKSHMNHIIIEQQVMTRIAPGMMPKE